MRHYCNSLLLCGIAFLWVPSASAQDITIRRVTDRVITLSMSNLSMHTRTYLQTLLDNLTQAQKDGLSLQQAKAKFPYSKEPVAMRRYFYKPENVSEQHLKTIDRIWELLRK